MVQLIHHQFSFGEYLELEAQSGTRHEFLAGQVFAMSGGTPDHAGITANITRLLGNALAERPCRVFSPDLRVRVQTTGLGTYADVTVVCGKLELDGEDPKGHTVVNPTLLVEVLSPSTEGYDRGEKLEHYKQIPALQEVMLVSTNRHQVEVVRRETDGTWSRTIRSDLESISLVSVGCDLTLPDIYRDPLA